MRNILIILGMALILIAVVFLYKQQLLMPERSDEEHKFSDDGQTKDPENETDLWRFYNDEQAGFSFKYPRHAVLQGGLDEDLSINIAITQIDDLGYPGFGKEEALENMESLDEGEYGKEFDWPLESSKKVTKVKNTNAQEFMVLGRFEICDVVFERKLIFYNNNYQIEFSLRGDRDKIIESMPQYFKTDSENCQDNKIWDFNKQNDFYQELSQGRGSVVAQDWFDIFDDIIKTIELTSSSTNSGGR